ncbi:MAG: 2-amino-4-hydroxy-6-hydroxymethyldihydropteridine diphosphokinase [Bradymonadia bacterium]|jgi:2-amino-4-hydroxy-6-hydroxymethyldihydropteridine diphosphokinase
MAKPHPHWDAYVFVGLGGNLGAVRSRFAATRLALRALARGPLIASPLVTSAPWGRPDQPDFINQVVGLQTSMDRATFFAALLRIEAIHGRDRARETRWGPRTLDLDVLTWRGIVDANLHLTLPHPRLQDRRFVLLPWAAIAPSLVVPGLDRSVADLLARCSDSGSVFWL